MSAQQSFGSVRTSKLSPVRRVTARIVALAFVGGGCFASTQEAALGAEVGWPTYNNGYDGQRYSPLAEINTGNVATLKRACVANLGDDGAFQAGPLMANNTLFVTTAHTTVALSASTCEVRWRQVHRPEQAVVVAINRGAALLGARVFRGTVDGRMLALDAATGEDRIRNPLPKMPRIALDDGDIKNVAAYVETLK